MALHTMQVIIIGLIMILAGTEASSCMNHCGPLQIPYPFGASEGCSLDESVILSCNYTFGSHKLFLGRNAVLSISLDGEIRVSTPIAITCYNQSGVSASRIPSELISSRFPISFKKNKFIAIGCDIIGFFNGSIFSLEKSYVSGCISTYISIENIFNGTCSGSGCCQSSIPPGLGNIGLILLSSDNHSNVLHFNPCDAAFVIEEKSFNSETVPTVLDWAVGNKTCLEAQKNLTNYACKAEHSERHNSNNGPGYLCKCSKGFQGNPFIFHGCQSNIYMHLGFFFFFFTPLLCLNFICISINITS